MTSGKRLALARWLFQPDNPLTARVIANRIWQHHFGRGIVPTPNDFGKLGEPPHTPAIARLAGLRNPPRWLEDETHTQADHAQFDLADEF